MNTVARAAAKYPAKAARYESLDHWRGAACLGVVVFHATMQVAGPVAAPAGEGFWASLGAALLAVTSRFWIGVPAFFVISGYCIMATLDSRRRRGDGLGEYLRRRVWRIYPPYWIALSASVLIVALFEYFLANPSKLPAKADDMHSPGEIIPRRVADFVASMTDRYAIELFERIFVPRYWTA